MWEEINERWRVLNNCVYMHVCVNNFAEPISIALVSVLKHKLIKPSYGCAVQNLNFLLDRNVHAYPC